MSKKGALNDFRRLKEPWKSLILTQTFHKFSLLAWLPDLPEQDHKSCSGKSGTLPSLINPAQAYQANNSSLINPSQANQASLRAWSILLRQVRRSGKQRKFLRSVLLPVCWRPRGCWWVHLTLPEWWLWRAPTTVVRSAWINLFCLAGVRGCCGRGGQLHHDPCGTPS